MVRKASWTRRPGSRQTQIISRHCKLAAHRPPVRVGVILPLNVSCCRVVSSFFRCRWPWTERHGDHGPLGGEQGGAGAPRQAAQAGGGGQKSEDYGRAHQDRRCRENAPVGLRSGHEITHNTTTRVICFGARGNSTFAINVPGYLTSTQNFTHGW